MAHVSSEHAAILDHSAPRLPLFPLPDAPTTSVIEAVVGPSATARPTLAATLAAEGLRLDDGPLSGRALRLRLRRLVEALARCGVRLVHIEHLDDDTLYDRLVELLVVEGLRSPHRGQRFELDFANLDDRDERRAYLAHYATDDERLAWPSWFPDEPLPPASPAPYSNRFSRRS